MTAHRPRVSALAMVLASVIFERLGAGFLTYLTPCDKP